MPVEDVKPQWLQEQNLDGRNYLGIEIDSKLNFKTHISKVQSKISKGVGILYKLNKLLPTRTLITLYYALIFPHLMYGIIIWGSTYSSYLTSLQTLQNKAIRAIAKLKSKDRITPIYKQYNLLITTTYTGVRLLNLCIIFTPNLFLLFSLTILCI